MYSNGVILAGDGGTEAEAAEAFIANWRRLVDGDTRNNFSFTGPLELVENRDVMTMKTTYSFRLRGTLECSGGSLYAAPLKTEGSIFV